MVVQIKYRPGNAFVVNSTYSKYAENEEEVLFTPYSKYKVINK